jgi:hypothetical protein
MFRYAKDAQGFLETVVPDYSRDNMRMETLTGRKIKGVTSHGHAILDALDRQGY